MSRHVSHLSVSGLAQTVHMIRRCAADKLDCLQETKFWRHTDSHGTCPTCEDLPGRPAGRPSEDWVVLRPAAAGAGPSWG
jgi:hypothetical protein